MLFIDPIELLRLRLPIAGNLEPPDVAAARQRLLTALATKGYNKVRYRGVNLDLQVALHAIQRLEDPVQLAFFCELHRTPYVRTFLRKPSLKSYQHLRKFPSKEKRLFYDHFKLELHRTFSHLLATMLEGYKWSALRYLLACPRWMDAESHAVRLQPLMQAIEAGLAHWKKLANVQSHEVYGLLDTPYLSVDLTILVNSLPQSHASIKQEWAEVVVAAAYRLYYKDYNVLAFRTIELSFYTNHSPTLRHKAMTLHKTLYPQGNYMLSGEYARKKTWREIVRRPSFWFAALLLTLFWSMYLIVFIHDLLA